MTAYALIAALSAIGITIILPAALLSYLYEKCDPFARIVDRLALKIGVDMEDYDDN